MARKASKPKLAEIPAEEESQAAPDDEEGTPVARLGGGQEGHGRKPAPADSGKAMSKSGAVKAAVDAGIDDLDEIADFAKKTFGLDIAKTHISAEKSRLKKKGDTGASEPAKRGRPPGSGTGAKRGRKPRVAAEATNAPTAKPQAANGSVVGDLAAVKALVEKLGVNEVIEIAKLFG